MSVVVQTENKGFVYFLLPFSAKFPKFQNLTLILKPSFLVTYTDMPGGMGGVMLTN